MILCITARMTAALTVIAVQTRRSLIAAVDELDTVVSNADVRHRHARRLISKEFDRLMTARRTEELLAKKSRVLCPCKPAEFWHQPASARPKFGDCSIVMVRFAKIELFLPRTLSLWL